MRRVLSFGLIALFLQFSKNVQSAEYKLHLAKVYSCDNSNTTYVVKDITINQYDDQSYVNVVVDLLQDLNIANMTVQIDKCDLSGENCNALGKFTLKDLCSLMFMKNTFWSPLIDAINPRPECPNLKKNTYVMQNSTVNMNDIVKVYSDSAKHYWKIQGTLNDMENKPVACGAFEGTAKAF